MAELENGVLVEEVDVPTEEVDVPTDDDPTVLEAGAELLQTVLGQVHCRPMQVGATARPHSSHAAGVPTQPPEFAELEKGRLVEEGPREDGPDDEEAGMPELVPPLEEEEEPPSVQAQSTSAATARSLDGWVTMERVGSARRARVKGQGHAW